MKDWKNTILKGEMRIVLFVSRNKDNKETIPNFKERTERFLTTLPIEEIKKRLMDTLLLLATGLILEIC